MTEAIGDLPGIDARWSKFIRVPDAVGIERRWHYLDNADVLSEQPVGTIFCVHGNPTWSYLWRRLLDVAASAERPWRVVAVDQLEMGYSERTGATRRMQERIDDLGRFTDALGLEGPVISVGHDWGGALSLGWAAAHREKLAGVVVTNTAIDQPEGSALPFLIGLASLPGVHWTSTVGTTMFLESTMATGQPRPSKEIRQAYLAPYRSAARRRGIGDFVADIPLREDHPSWPARQKLLESVQTLRDVPTLILWGTKDPVFTEVHFRYLKQNLPHATVHRFEKAGHLVVEDAEVAEAVVSWLENSGVGQNKPVIARPSSSSNDRTAAKSRSFRRPLGQELEDRDTDTGAAIVELLDSGERRSIGWADLANRVRCVAAGLLERGVQPGDRVALLVTPGLDLTAAIYACLRIGAVIVVVDAGLGVRGMHRALRASNPDYLIGIDRALVPARVLNWAPNLISAGLTGVKGSLIARASRARQSLDDLAALGAGLPLPPPPSPEAEAAVVFTTGSTGPAKGVVYRYRQIEAARDALLNTYEINSGDGFVAAFAPFALFGPSLGVTSVVPAMDVTAPKTLTAKALAEALDAVDARGIFASPAALTNVLKTAGGVNAKDLRAFAKVDLLLSAGAPVSAAMLRELLELMPNAEPHTPYGMTEALPVTDVTLDEVEDAGPGNGVMVGKPIEAAEVIVLPLDGTGRPAMSATSEAGVTGEIAIRAEHVKDHYDKLWWTEKESRFDDGWHRSGDVGHFDHKGQLWVEGRLRHVITGPGGVVTPIGVEQRVEELDGVARAAAVGVGPVGAQQVVVVVETDPPATKKEQASPSLASEVRRVAGRSVAAVFVVPELPTDIRHNSKVKRELVAAWATRKLAGARGGGWGRVA